MTFQCDRCARCCRHHVVPVTQADVLRLRAHTGLLPDHFIELRAPEEIDLTDEPESVAYVTDGPCAPILARKNGACVFLEALPDGREGCSVHAARPASCRAYPFDRPDTEEGHPAAIGLHPGALCPDETGYRTVALDAEQAAAWAIVVTERDLELHAHAEEIARWNTRQRVRRRMGRAPQSGATFLRVIGAASRPSVDHSSGSSVAGHDASDGVDVGAAKQIDVHE